MTEMSLDFMFLFFGCKGRPSLPLLRKAINRGRKKNSNYHILVFFDFAEILTG